MTAFLRTRGWRRGATCLLLGLALLAPARAHMLNMTRLNVVVDPAPELALTVDVDLALLLGGYEEYRALLLLPAGAQRPQLETLGRRVLAESGVSIDGVVVDYAPRSWTLPPPPERIGDQTIAAMTTFRYQETLPPGARELTVAPGSLAKIEFPLAYTFSVPSTQVSFTRWLELPGGTSRVLKLPERTTVVAVQAPAPAFVAGPETPTAPMAAVVAPVARAEDFTPFELATARVVATVLQHLRLGFRHIFPQGIDHVLFVLGLFLLAPKWRPLLSQTTAFTIAHTTTLGLAAYGVVSLPARLVEPLIALSIAYVAVENIWKPQLRPARVAVVFMFGLLHGLGFASSLSEVPMPRDQFFTALLSFNLGVDFGQLAVIAVAFALVGWFRHKSWYRKAIVIPACSVIAAIGLYWTVDRTFF